MTKPIFPGGSPPVGILLIHIPHHTFSPCTIDFTIGFLVRNPVSTAGFTIRVYRGFDILKTWGGNSAPGSATTDFQLTHTEVIANGDTDVAWSIYADTVTTGNTLYFSEIDFTVREISK